MESELSKRKFEQEEEWQSFLLGREGTVCACVGVWDGWGGYYWVHGVVVLP
jgi:hypothetical protein